MQHIDVKPYHIINTSHMFRECALAWLHAAWQWKGQDEDARSTCLRGKTAFTRVAGWCSTTAAKVVLNSSGGVMRRQVLGSKARAAFPVKEAEWAAVYQLQFKRLTTSVSVVSPEG